MSVYRVCIVCNGNLTRLHRRRTTNLWCPKCKTVFNCRSKALGKTETKKEATRFPEIPNVEVRTDKKEYMHGEPGVVYLLRPTGTLKARLVVINRGTAPIELLFNSSQRYDFVLRDSKGKEVARWSEGQGFTEVLGKEVVEPGGKLSFEENLLLGEIRRPLPIGKYQLEGLVTVADDGLMDTTTFRIVSTPLPITSHTHNSHNSELLEREARERERRDALSDWRRLDLNPPMDWLQEKQELSIQMDLQLLDYMRLRAHAQVHKMQELQEEVYSQYNEWRQGQTREYSTEKLRVRAQIQLRKTQRALFRQLLKMQKLNDNIHQLFEDFLTHILRGDKALTLSWEEERLHQLQQQQEACINAIRMMKEQEPKRTTRSPYAHKRRLRTK